MKKINIAYWICTIIFAGLMAFSAIPDILMLPDAMKFITDLGYPRYFIPFISYAKILGAVAILVPGYPRLKEWAYAGLTFDLVGATFSVVAIGTPVSAMAPMLIWFAFLVASYVLYHKRYRMKQAGGLAMA